MRRTLFVLLALLALAMLAHLILPLSALESLRQENPDTAWLLLREIRLPRTLLALGYGAALGVTGAALQAVFANPLASPDLTGSSSGAALGAVLAGYWFGISQPLLLAAAGSAGAIVALALVVGLAGRRSDSSIMLLSGLAVSLAAGAATTLLLALAPSPFAFYDSFEWLMGSFVDRSLPQAAVAVLPAAMCCVLLLTRSQALDLLALGEDVMASLGHDPRRLTLIVVALASIAVGACVSVCGAIGFVGLIAPYVGRRLTGGHPGRALLPAGIIGSLLLLIADLGVRLAPAGRLIPVGVLTTVVGAPLFIWIVVTMRRRVTA